MTDPVEIAVIGAVASVVIGLFNGYVLIKVHNQNKEQSLNIGIVREHTNGLTEKLLAAERGLAHQEGMAAQRKEDKQ